MLRHTHLSAGPRALASPTHHAQLRSAGFRCLPGPTKDMRLVSGHLTVVHVARRAPAVHTIACPPSLKGRLVHVEHGPPHREPRSIAVLEHPHVSTRGAVSTA